MAEKKPTKEEKENLQFVEKLENMKQYAKAVDDILKLVDLTSSTTKTWTVFSKDSLRSYLQNPYKPYGNVFLHFPEYFSQSLLYPHRSNIFLF